VETCPRCGGTVKIIASIEDDEVIEKILAQRSLSPLMATMLVTGEGWS